METIEITIVYKNINLVIFVNKKLKPLKKLGGYVSFMYETTLGDNLEWFLDASLDKFVKEFKKDKRLKDCDLSDLYNNLQKTIKRAKKLKLL